MARMKIGAQAIGAIGLMTSMTGLANSLIVLEYPMISPRGTATTRASRNPKRNVLRLDAMYAHTVRPPVMESPLTTRSTRACQVSSGVGMAVEFSRMDTSHHANTKHTNDVIVMTAVLNQR